MKFLFGLLALTCLLAGAAGEASLFPGPNELSQKFFKENKFESEDLTWFRFSQKPDWGDRIRVNLSAGGNLPWGSDLGFFENRYFFLNTDATRVISDEDVLRIFKDDGTVNFTGVQGDQTRKTFDVEIVHRYLFVTVTVRCRGESELSGPFLVPNGRYDRFQVHLSQCRLNDSLEVMPDGWLTLDTYSYDKFPGKTAIQMRNLFRTRGGEYKGREIKADDLFNLTFSISDRLLLGLFGDLGYHIDKSYLWRHQN
jgi:hypothetical protein